MKHVSYFFLCVCVFMHVYKSEVMTSTVPRDYLFLGTFVDGGVNASTDVEQGPMCLRCGYDKRACFDFSASDLRNLRPPELPRHPQPLPLPALPSSLHPPS